MAFTSVLDNYRRLKENDAFTILVHPAVLKNYRQYQKEYRERPLIMKSQPPGIEIELTNRCNLACIQCLRSLGLKPYKLGDIEYENFQRILAQFPYVMNLSVNGFGEPMMYKRFFDVIAYTRKERPWCKIGIYSNGMLIDQEKAERLMDSGLTELNISIDAAFPNTYRRVRRGGNLEVLHENIRRLVRTKRQTGARFPMLGINFVMLNENVGELVPFVEQAHEFGVDFINCITFAAYDWGFKNRRSRESYHVELEQAKARMEQLGVRCKSFPDENASWSDPSKPFFCPFFWGEEFRVAYSGDITLGCCTPFKETYSYGNLLEHDFWDIWNNELFQRNRELALRNEPPSKTCASCDQFCKTFFTQREETTVGLIPMASLAGSDVGGRPSE